MSAVTDHSRGLTASPLGDLQMIDVDSHEMLPTTLWPEAFGDAGVDMAAISPMVAASVEENTPIRDHVVVDEMDVTDEIVWNQKGPEAPGAIDLKRRELVLDVMGVERQLLFPTFGLIALLLVTNPEALAAAGLPDDFDAVGLGVRACKAYNKWAGKISDETRRRVRPVGVLPTNTDIDSLMAEAENLLNVGIKAVWIPGSIPPCGTSPGDQLLDPFWDLLAKADVPITLHLGTEFGLLASKTWNNGVPQFRPSLFSSVEFPIEPYGAATLHLTQNNFLAAMVLGGVFERHPTLRFGVIETAAHWVGPLGETLDLWFEEFYKRLSPVLSMRPSEYIARNIRVTPYHFERVDRYIERYPEMVDVFCYSSDYPHLEGGRDTARKFAGYLENFDAETKEKFFRTNGLWIVP